MRKDRIRLVALALAGGALTIGSIAAKPPQAHKAAPKTVEVLILKGRQGYVYSTMIVHRDERYMVTAIGEVSLGKNLHEHDADGIAGAAKQPTVGGKLKSLFDKTKAGIGRTLQDKSYTVYDAPVGALLVRTQPLGSKPVPKVAPAGGDDQIVQDPLQEKDWVTIGKKGEYVATRTGLLRFVLNDSVLHDDSGSFTIKIVKIPKGK